METSRDLIAVEVGPAISYLFFADNSLVFTRANSVNCLAIQKVLESRSGQVISYLFFTDDSLIFTRANSLNCLASREVLERYAKASRQIINFSKSAMCVSPSILAREGEQLAALIGVNLVTCHEKYLGLPCFTGRSKRVVFADIINRVWNILKGWGEKLCTNKANGELGFRNLENFNKALLAKQGWMILHQPDSLAARTLKGCYFKDFSFLEATNKLVDSFVWKSIVWGRDILNAGMRWRIGNGSTTSIYNDKWIPRPSTFRIISQPVLGRDATVDSLLTLTGGWNIHRIKHNFVKDNADAIFSIPLGTGKYNDSLIWHYED
ncbi:hypothetical protein Dsin_005072 [Dipteronia sinensis]|uniref:Reverse transcriptase n=1 Tax=Dipteronia sinensis TaxID=43782 RepID=A0AAE0AWS7_9ROSI|nr:hypothetical protein Dsin_005072 [Dipteronia sinensis]